MVLFDPIEAKHNTGLSKKTMAHHPNISWLRMKQLP